MIKTQYKSPVFAVVISEVTYLNVVMPGQTYHGFKAGDIVELDPNTNPEYDNGQKMHAFSNGVFVQHLVEGIDFEFLK